MNSSGHAREAHRRSQDRGTQIILGMSQGPFKDEGYTKEIHEVYIYEKIK